MKIAFATDDLLGQSVIEARAEANDGIPAVPRLWVDGRLRWNHPSRTALACVLLLDGCISQSISLDPGCDPAMAAAIRRFLRPRAVQIVSGATPALPPPPASRMAVIGRARDTDGGFALRLAPDTQLRSIVEPDRAVLASNLRTLLKPGQPEAWLELALAVLYAGNLYIDAIRVDRSDLSWLGPARCLALTEALAEAGIALCLGNPGGGEEPR
ncbi:hypothetical protein [Roseomonas sp. USHLN139]|uniref:hypothetical protein n=1 Tax=Roseomonas sp. USHLN139 TaxID=3081298 RepID=UPI003B020355